MSTASSSSSIIVTILVLLCCSSIRTVVTATRNVAALQDIVYRATITPIPLGASIIKTPDVSGFVTLFKQPNGPLVGYAGIVTGVESNLFAKTCNATNGCGVHIHSGTSCFNTTTQGGHYYDNTTYPIDPWINERYSSDSTGKTNFHSILDMGNVDIDGHAFIVHSYNGTRIGCGIIERVPTGKNQIYNATTTPLLPSTADGAVLVVPTKGVPGTVCFFGGAINLEPNLISYLNQNRTYVGTDCNSTNGCGVHIHNGTSCFNRTTQGGHYYNEVTYPIDPWLTTMYESTDIYGNTNYIGCVEMGVTNIIDKPFVIHSNNGTRVACGLLGSDAPADATFILIDPIADKHIGTVGSTVDYATLGTTTNYLNMKVDFIRDGYSSVFVTFDKPKRSVCEATEPYSIFGDVRGNYHARVIPLGPHTVTATPYNNKNCSGTPARSIVTKTFTVKGCTISYIVRNVATKGIVTTLTSGASIARSSTYINIEAAVSCGFTIRTVRMIYRKGNQVLRDQNELDAPYYLYGNRGTSIGPGTRLNSAGSYSISTFINDIDHGLLNFTVTA